MTQDFVPGLFLGMLGGLTIACILWLALQQACKSDVKKLEQIELHDRKRQKLMSTQSNIAGRIYNALQEGLKNNLRCGSKMAISQSGMSGGVFTIQIFYCGINPAPSVKEITVACDPLFLNVQISDGSLFGLCCTNSPNDPELTSFIGRQLDFLRDWSPRPTVPQTVA